VGRKLVSAEEHDRVSRAQARNEQGKGVLESAKESNLRSPEQIEAAADRDLFTQDRIRNFFPGSCRHIGRRLTGSCMPVGHPSERLNMHTRRSLLIAAALSAFSSWTSAWAQAPAQATEASLREAMRKYVDAWNRHDVKAWSNMLAEDIWYTETLDYYGKMKGRKAVVHFFSDVVKTTDLTWEVIRMRMMPDGTATVVLRHVSLVLPKVNGKYKLTFESVPSVSRWRYERGAWKMFYFTTHKGLALDAMKTDGVE